MVKKILPLLTLLFAVIMVIAIVMIVGEVKDSQEAINDFDELAELITDYPVSDESESATEPKNSETESSEETEPLSPAPVFTRNLAPLFEKNADCIGWVYIKDTAVDYPVMHTPSEPQRYLRLNFDKEYSTAGVPFLKGVCTLESDNLVIYGHNIYVETESSILQLIFNYDKFENLPIEFVENFHYRTIIPLRENILNFYTEEEYEEICSKSHTVPALSWLYVQKSTMKLPEPDTIEDFVKWYLPTYFYIYDGEVRMNLSWEGRHLQLKVVMIDEWE